MAEVKSTVWEAGYVTHPRKKQVDLIEEWIAMAVADGREHP